MWFVVGRHQFSNPRRMRTVEALLNLMEVRLQEDAETDHLISDDLVVVLLNIPSLPRRTPGFSELMIFREFLVGASRAASGSI